MAVILWVMGLLLLMQGCLCSPEQRGCLKWTQKGENVCCDRCRPGNRLVQDCGPDPRELCTPCEPNTYTKEPKAYSCTRCRQCVGAHVLLKKCTATTDTTCGCKEGLACGDDRCSFCVEKCGKGQEPSETRSCRPCPNGTFNDQIHQKCKPRSTKCPNPDEIIVADGDAVTDIKCANVFVYPVVKSTMQPDHTERAWPFVLSVVTSAVLMGFSIIIIIIVGLKIFRKRKEKKPKKLQIPKTPIIRTPTDDPATLIAIECSFHEAQQEQGSSSESLASKDSSEQLIA